jgi:hypothetical protein
MYVYNLPEAPIESSTEMQGSKALGSEREGRQNQGNMLCVEEKLIDSSCQNKAQQEVLPDQVQGPLPTSPLHPCPQGQREGREAKGVPTTQYVYLILNPQFERMQRNGCNMDFY